MNEILCYLLGLILFILIAIKIYIKLTTGKCRSTNQMNGKVVIITGGNSGIGKATAMDLAARGAKVILACRNLKTAEKTKEEIIKRTKNSNIIVKQLDLESLRSVREFSKYIHETENCIHVLINNAGSAIRGNRLTEDQLAVTMQVNHFGPFLLTNLLLDLLKKASPSRIITVSSMLHRYAKLDLTKIKTGYDTDFITYCNSKLCNILMANEFARRLEGTFVTSNSLHPGAVNTYLFQHRPFIFRSIIEFFASIYFKTVEEGAQTSIYLAVSDDVKYISGEYYEDCIDSKILNQGKDEALAKKLWEISEEAVQLQPHEIHL
ncbi:retinol dehydrogenase 11-like [Chrysoperla carnea]|uniref:retinol dehydrogenase 11-like n=1 Tax=Chrysoperla carnea TaxID=189513 RepID=UPI001D074DF0|nr:retinol dehydrogenase 11-like [Chrysoperla carnea]